MAPLWSHNLDWRIDTILPASHSMLRMFFSCSALPPALIPFSWLWYKLNEGSVNLQVISILPLLVLLRIHSLHETYFDHIHPLFLPDASITPYQRTWSSLSFLKPWRVVLLKFNLRCYKLVFPGVFN